MSNTNRDIEDCRSTLERYYEKGLNDAWELARKIDLFDEKERAKIFGYLTSEYIKERYTVQEALAKLEAYEKEIKVGDVVISDAGHKALVVGFDKGNKDGIFVMRNDGVTGLRVKQSYTKTGKHIEIQKILEQIGGAE